jgi:hypothetical protein
MKTLISDIRLDGKLLTFFLQCSLKRERPQTFTLCRKFLAVACFQDTGLFCIVFCTSYIFFGEAQFRPLGRPNTYMYTVKKGY